MIVDKKALVQHLNRIYCGGQIREVVLAETFAASALTLNQALLVCSGGLPGCVPMEKEVGIIDLQLLIKSLSMFGEDENNSVTFDVDDFRVVLSAPHQGTVRLVTGEQISTRISADLLEKVLSVFKDKTVVPLPQNVVEGCLNTISLLKADEVRVSVDTSGVTFRVGNENSNYAEFTFKGTRAAKKADAYELVLDAGIVQNVLAQVDDYTSAEVTLTGPASLVRIECSGYQYIISPQDPAQ